MKVSPKVSVIIPIYNAEKYLKMTLNSVLQQKYCNFEVIMIDDGSTDSSIEICKDFAERDSRFLWWSKENGGVCSARNFGLTKATGKYVLFIDSDDWIEQSLLDECIPEIENSQADMLIFGMQFDIEKNGRIVKSLCKTCDSKRFNISDLGRYYKELYGHNYITSMCNRIIKLDQIFESEICFDERITNYEDMLFCLQYIPNCTTIQVVSEVYYHYILRDTPGMSRKYKPNFSLTIETTATELCRAIDNLQIDKPEKAWARADIQRILWLGVANVCRADCGFADMCKRVRELCSEEWVSTVLPMKVTGNKYNDICVFLAKNNSWLVLVLFNMTVNFLRDKWY